MIYVLITLKSMNDLGSIPLFVRKNGVNMIITRKNKYSKYILLYQLNKGVLDFNLGRFYYGKFFGLTDTTNMR